MDDAALDALIADEEAAYMQMEEDECMQFMQPAAAAPFLPVAEFEDTLLPAPPPPASLSPQACPVAPVVCTPPPRTAQPLAGTPAPKPVAPRRRFKQKQPDLDGAYGVAAQLPPRVHTSEIWNDVDVEKFLEMDHRSKYFCVFNKFRHYLHKVATGKEPTEPAPGLVELLHSGQRYRMWSKVQKAVTVRYWLEQYPAPDAVRLFCHATWCEKDVVALKTRKQGKSLLLTWQGPWGVLEVEDAILKWPIVDMVQWLRKAPAVLQLWTEAASFVKAVVAMWGQILCRGSGGVHKDIGKGTHGLASPLARMVLQRRQVGC